MQIVNKVTKRGALGMMLMLALWFAPSAARAAARHVKHAKTHIVHKRKAVASRTRKASLQHVTYKYKKTTVRTRRVRWHRRHVWRRRVILPRQPSRDRTEQIQEALERGGYYTGNPNGKWDARMAESLRRFQTANGLPPTGKLDALSLEKMGLGSDTAGVGAPRTTTPGTPAATPSAPSTPKTPGN